MRVVTDVDPIADRDGWLALRKTGLGGSDITAVVGLSPYGTQWSVYVDKIGAGPEDEPTEAMRLGQLLEPIILELFTERTGLHVEGRQLMVRHPDHDWAFATVDGFAYDHHPDAAPHPYDADPLAVVEVKRTGDHSWDQGIPKHYIIQAQWNMMCSGLGSCILAVLHPRAFRTYELEADPDDQTALLKLASEFWHENVEAEKPPPVEAADNRRMAAIWPESEEREVEIDVVLANDLAIARRQIKRYEAEKDRLEAEIKALLEEAGIATVEGRKAATWGSHERRSIDTKALRRDHPDIAEQYQTKTTVRPFRFNWKEEQ